MPSPKKVSRALILGDGLVLLVFIVVGWLFHKVPGDWFWQLARIGLPFVIGYFTAATLLGALTRGTNAQSFARKSIAAWLYGIALSLLLRTILEGRVPVGSFVVVTAIFTALTLLGWRSIFWWLSRPMSSASGITPRAES